MLAPSFMHSGKGLASLAIKRFVRLGIPVLIASLLALVLLLLLPNSRAHVSMLSRSAWLAALGLNPLTAVALTKDILLSAMVIGYEGSSVFASLANILPPAMLPTSIGLALNAPSWTLHVEFWGSMLVLAFSVLWRSLNKWLFWALYASAVLLLGSNHFNLFLFGFLLFHVYANNTIQGKPWHAGIGVALIVMGMYVCVVKDVTIVSLALEILHLVSWFDALSNFHWQSQVGAMSVFCGVLLSASAQSWFANPLAQWLGKVSFSVYLLHFPILITVGCAVFLLLPGSYALACLASALAGATMTFVLASLFEKYVDRRAVRWSKQLSGESSSIT